ncbi:hypothetical protein [Microbacterium sp. YY-01]|uniref:hypothetical protein n=1 Tax=Microbacterium sp. YY-01 TaxID=3421634 RepID=UPI003D1660A6
MNAAAQILLAAAAEAEHGNIALQTLPAGLIAAAIFALLGCVTLSYRSVANRHPEKAEAWAKAHGKTDSGAQQGH